MSQRAWNVYVRSHDLDWNHTREELYDTVFFDENMTAPEVYRSLIDHDGYPDNSFLRWTHTDEDGDIVECEYPSDFYGENDEYDKELRLVHITPKGEILE